LPFLRASAKGFAVKRRPTALALASLLAAVAVSFARAARSEEPALSPSDQRALSAFAAGVAAATMPLVIGGARQADLKMDDPLSNKSLTHANTGWIIAGAGLSLAPIAAHVAVRSYERAALFGIVPAAATAGIGALVAVNPRALYDGVTGSRTPFALLFTTVAATSAIGVIDAMHPLWGNDASKANVAVHVTPMRLSIEGAW
jgi:hypothetical protein